MPGTVREFDEYVDQFAEWARVSGAAHIGRGYSPELLAVVYSEQGEESVDSTLLHGFTRPDGSPDIERVLRALVIVARQVVVDIGGKPSTTADAVEVMRESDEHWDQYRALRERVATLRTRVAEFLDDDSERVVAGMIGKNRAERVTAIRDAMAAFDEGDDDDARTV